MAHPVVHFEIGCRDRAKADEFYSKLFGWRMEQAGPASMIETGSEGGIGSHITALGHEPHHYVTFCVQVEELQAYLDRAQALGGKTLVPPVVVPGRGHFAWMADPDPNLIGLWKPKA